MTRLTRQHFQSIAEAVNTSRSSGSLYPLSQDEALDQVAEELADVLRQYNPEFDRARFLTACGMEGQ